MKRTLVKFRNSKLQTYVSKHQKYVPLIFFVGGFTFDSLTLGRIDRMYDLTVLCLHMTLLTITLYFYNLAEDENWKDTFVKRYQKYFPLAIQFFFGALSSANVIYYSRSVSLSKTISFFIILVTLLIANEFLKKRISNKYLQFSIYFFITFTFFTFIIPVLIKVMNTAVFIFSGLVSLAVTLTLIVAIFKRSPSTRAEVCIRKIIGLVVTIYAIINLFYYFKLIPPVPLALESGIIAHNVKVENNNYIVSYEPNEWYVFWRAHKLKFIHKPNESVYVFASIFAPTDIEKSIFHRWTWYNDKTEEWEIVDDIGYHVSGGRDAGYRGFTYKNNVKQGLWKVEVITKEELVIGVINFEIITSTSLHPISLVDKKF